MAEAAAATEGKPEKLKVDKFADGSITLLKFSGTIDEEFSGKKLAGTLKSGTYVLDLNDISKISSFGIREWVDFVNQLSGKAEAVYFIECAPKVVDQLNMVANFAGPKGKVFSFYAPFRCDYCDADRKRLFQSDRDADQIKSMKPQEKPCDQCGNPEYFDEDPLTYFSYVAGQGAVELPTDVAGFLSTRMNYAVADGARKLRIDKQIEGRSTYLKVSGDLDGSFPTDKLAEGLEGQVVFDLSSLGKIDPAGAAEWRQLMAKATPGCEQIILCGCTPAFAERLTTPQDLGAKGVVMSFSMPYSCAKCATTSSQVIDVAEHHEVLKFATPPEMKCKDCGGPTSCVAGEGLLSHVATLAKPNVDAATRKFIKTAQDKPVQRPKSPEFATTVAGAQSRGMSMAFMALMALAAAGLAVGGFVFYQKWQASKAAAEAKANTARRDSGRFVESSVGQGATEKARPPWVLAADTPAAGTVVGMSSLNEDQKLAEEEAQAMGLAGVVDLVATAASKDNNWKAVVFSKYGDAQRKLYDEFREAKAGSDDGAYDQARRRLRERAKEVAATLRATAGAALPPAAASPSEVYWEKHQVGTGHKFKVWTLYKVPPDTVTALAAQYTETAGSLGAKVYTLFPGIAWRWSDKELKDGGAIVATLESSSPLRQIGINEGYVVTAVRGRPVTDRATFVKILDEEYALLKANGGNMPLKVKKDDGALSEFGVLVQKTAAATGGNSGGSRPGGGNSGGSGGVPTSSGNVFSDDPNE
ncbi:MAG: PDZ domain-containing protein [Deltaproteobacteria bacterium]|nr:PDZ domain-containing protein [Deltaproteobacteria bacterium]